MKVQLMPGAPGRARVTGFKGYSLNLELTLILQHLHREQQKIQVVVECWILNFCLKLGV